MQASPPPLIAKHGYIHTHWHGARLRYDEKLEAYSIARRPHHYYKGEHFYRYERASWHRAHRLRGPWAQVDIKDLPRGLKKYAKKVEKKERKAAKKAEKEARRRAKDSLPANSD